MTALVVSERRLSRRDVVEGGQRWAFLFRLTTMNERSQLVGTPNRKASGHIVSPRRRPRMRQHAEGMGSDTLEAPACECHAVDEETYGGS